MLNEEWLTASEVAKVYKVHPSWIYQKTRDGEIPHLRLGKYIRYDRAEVADYFEKFRQKVSTSISGS